MDSRSTHPLILKFIAGEGLTATEQAQLHQMLESSLDLRDEILRDEDVDCALVTLGQYESSADDFVSSTLTRIAQLPSELPTDVASKREASTAIEIGSRLASPASGLGSKVRSSSRRLMKPWERFLVVVATVFIMVGLGVIVTVVLSRAVSPVSESHVARQDDRMSEPNRSVQPGFAYVSETQGLWAGGQRAGDRLDSGLVELAEGESIIKFDKGTEARIKGPAVLDLRSPDEVFLMSGELRVLVPGPAIGFTVVTPMARVIDLGTEFEVSVAPTGTTEALVHQGAVEFLPVRTGEVPGKSIELTAAGLNQAISSIPSIDAPALPVSTEVRGIEGRFMGMISSGGRTLEFTSAEEFFEYQSQVMRQLQAAPLEFEQAWSQMVRGGMGTLSESSVGHGAHSSSRNVTVSVNGQTVSISEDSSTGIKVIVSSRIDGELRQVVVEARDAEELRLKNRDAWELYRSYLGSEDE